MANYTTGIPLPTDRPSVSQDAIMQNFTSANTIFDDNHYAFTNATLKGKHKIVVMQDQVGPAVTTSTQAAIYAKNIDTLPAVKMRLFLGQAGGLPADQVQLTGPTPIFTPYVYNGKPALRANTFLPGGLLFQYGYFYYDSGTTPSVLYASSFSGGFAAYSIQLTLERSSGSAVTLFVDEGSSTDSLFKMSSSVSGDHYVYWTAIGPS